MTAVTSPDTADREPSLTPRSLPTARSPGADGDVLGAWAEWLSTQWEWDWFFTGTFAPLTGSATHTLVGWNGSDKRFRAWVSGLPANADPWWVRAREPHQFRNATHFHALIGGVGNLRRDAAWRSWFERNGQGRVDPIRGTAECAGYVAKYVLKSGGELVFSENAKEHMRCQTPQRLPFATGRGSF